MFTEAFPSGPQDSWIKPRTKRKPSCAPWTRSVSANVLALLDPAVVSPPVRRALPVAVWLRRLRQWSQTLGGAPVDLVLPDRMCAGPCGYAAVSAALASDPEVFESPGDVMRLIDRLHARAQDPARLQPEAIE